MIRTDDLYSIQGYIRELNVVSVNVPFEHHSTLEPFIGKDIYGKQLEGPRYSVKLAFGQRLEPSVVDLETVSRE